MVITKALSASYYNKLGNSNTSYCVRMQAVNAKIVYDVAKKTPKKQRTWINIVKKNKKGPFGIVKLKHTTGKLKNSRKTDPTDPVLFPGNHSPLSNFSRGSTDEYTIF